MRRIVLCAAAIFAFGSSGYAQTVYPIDRAEILAGSRFDVKVEFPGLVKPAEVTVTLNGADASQVFRQGPAIRREGGRQGAVGADPARRFARQARQLCRQGNGAGREPRTDLDCVTTPVPRKAKNVILLIGDGLSPAHRVAARLMSKGIAEGKAFGKLAMDDMPQMALVATAGIDSIITNSANSASAYATGHKSAVNAMGVYADRTADPFDDPKVETISSLVKRRGGMSVGIVSNTEIQDATPAAMIAHTRRRATYDEITEQYFGFKPDVLMGGGACEFPAARARRAPSAATRSILSRNSRTTATPLLRMRRSLQGGAGGYQKAARPVQSRQHGRRARPQIPESAAASAISRSARSHRHDRGRAESPVAESERLLPDGRIRDDRQIHASARHGARGLRHHHVRQCGAAGARLGEGARRRHADPRGRRPQPSGQRSSAPSTTTCRARRTCRCASACASTRRRASRIIPRPTRKVIRRASMSAGRIAMFSASLPDHYETFRPRLDNPNEPTVPGKRRAPSMPTSATRMCPARCCASAICRGSPMPACIPART